MPHETQEIPSPASSITKLGFVRFCPEEPGIAGDLRRIRIIELPSFSLEEPERPRVKMKRLSGRRRAWTANDRASAPPPHAMAGDDPAASSAQRARTSTLQGVEPFPVRSLGSSPVISIAACEGTPVAGAPVLAGLAASDATPTDVDLVPIAERDGAPTEVDFAPLGYEAAATPAELAAAEVETEQALLLLQRLRRLSQPPITEAEHAAVRRLRRLTLPRPSGASQFDAVAEGTEIVVGAPPARAKWRAAIIGAAVAVATAAVGLATLL